MSKHIEVINGDLISVDNASDLAVFYPGTPIASALVMKVRPGRTITLPINLTGSIADAEVAATALTTFTIKKGASTIGTIDFAISATIGTFTFASAQTITASDKLTIVAPASPDLTLADIAITIVATR